MISCATSFFDFSGKWRAWPVLKKTDILFEGDLNPAPASRKELRMIISRFLFYSFFF